MHPLKSLRVRVLDHYPADADLPHYAHEDDSGFDLVAAIDNTASVLPGNRTIVPTGISVEIPEGYELQVRSRSGLAAKHGIFVLNSPGTVDASYRGEIKVILSAQARSFMIRRGDRIAQAVLAPVMRAEMYFDGALNETTRGADGFGSTGV